MKKNLQGKVLKLFITKNDTDKTRINTSHIDADEHGILNDKFYNKNDQRAILITSIQSYNMAYDTNINLSDGALGENILIDINPYHLNTGETFTIGDTTLEITQNCTLCKGLSIINPKLPKLLKNDRGIFAKIISGPCVIKVGDTVSI
ncbi:MULTISPECIES: MOSC domain-containing protein [Sulfurimonas]|uniref:MOSC domain-containing protein n=1 Tax=Sulfurimonas TaxID=202746 RepID=UPI00125FE7EC|nr:MOSC domain-containing protein [Sulfurimonas hydrogeniphila]